MSILRWLSLTFSDVERSLHLESLVSLSMVLFQAEVNCLLSDKEFS